MSFKMIIRLLKKNPFDILFYSLFLSLLFTLVIVFLSISLSLPNKFKEMVKNDAKISFFIKDVILDDVPLECIVYTSPNFVNTNTPVLVDINGSIDDLYVIFNRNDDAEKAYVNQYFADSLNIKADDIANVKIGMKEYRLSIIIKDDVRYGLNVSKSLYDSSIAGIMEVSISNFSDFDNLFSFADEHNIDLSEVEDYGYFDLYNNVKSVQTVFMLLSIIVFIYTIISIFNVVQYKLLTDKKNLSILKLLGMSNRRLFNIEMVYFILMGIISIIIACLFSGLILLYFSNESSLLFDNRIHFDLIWYSPIIVLLFYIFAFVIIGGRKIRISVNKMDIIDYVKEVEL